MKKYFRVMLGPKSMYAAECFSGGFIGTDFGLHLDLQQQLPDDWRLFNKAMIPIYIGKFPEKSKISAGLACGALWTVSKGIQIGDNVLCPDGTGYYRVGEVTGEYQYHEGKILPHRRPVHWSTARIDRAAMSESLKNSTGSIGTVSDVSRYHDELENLVIESETPKIIATDASIESPSVFALEAHLEEFLVKNWAHTELGRDFDIYEDEGEKAQQYQTDTGPLDILAISKDKKKLLVVELKKGRASDAVVGQTLRYMNYVQDELAEQGQCVEGVIVALENDMRLRRAIAMTPSISFYRYQVSFKLIKD